MSSGGNPAEVGVRVLALTKSRYAEMPPRGARLILAVLALLIAYGISLPEDRTWTAEVIDPGIGDSALFQGIAERVRKGDDYYAASYEELKAHNYPTHSVFNFRLPTLAFLMASLPMKGMARLLLGALGVLNLLLWTWYWLENQKSLLDALLGGILILTSSVACFLDVASYFTEVWSGTLISISLISHANKRPVLTLMAGLAALFIRELALPYVLIMSVFALKERRFGEALAWLGGLLAFAVYLGIHASFVADVASDSLLTANEWLQWGGWLFLLSTARSNALLLVMPQWVSAVAFPLALLGLAGWKSPVGARVAATVAAYGLAFMVIGQPFNVYWGLIYVHLVALGMACSIASLVDLARASALRPRSA